MSRDPQSVGETLGAEAEWPSLTSHKTFTPEPGLGSGLWMLPSFLLPLLPQTAAGTQTL